MWTTLGESETCLYSFHSGLPPVWLDWAIFVTPWWKCFLKGKPKFLVTFSGYLDKRHYLRKNRCGYSWGTLLENFGILCALKFVPTDYLGWNDSSFCIITVSYNVLSWLFIRIFTVTFFKGEYSRHCTRFWQI